MKHMLFIRPRITEEYLEKVKYEKVYHTFPLGILSIIAYCKSKISDMEYHIADYSTLECDGMTLPQMLEDIEYQVRKYNPDIIGISTLSSAIAEFAEPVAATVKKILPHSSIIAGGTGMSVLSLEEYNTNFPHVDAISFSEGEIPIVELLSAGDLWKELESNHSFITHKKAASGNFVPQAKRIENLDDIPFYPLELIDLNQYENTVLETKGQRSFPMHTVRGCPFSCRFCSGPGISGKKMRSMSAERVVEDIKKYVNEYGYTELMLLDEQLLAKRERAKKILTAISELGIMLSLPNGMNIALVDEEIAAIFQKIRLDRYVFAIESGSPRVLKELMDKPVKLEQASKTLSLLYTDRWETHSNFIVGMPGETDADRRESAEYIKENALDWVTFFAALPLRGSDLYRECKENNWLVVDEDGNERIKNNEIDPNEMDKVAYLLNLECNFVYNYAMRHGYYNKAKARFDFVRNKYPHHAFAHYFYAKVCEVLREEEEADSAKQRYFDILKSDAEWSEYALIFGLPLTE